MAAGGQTNFSWGGMTDDAASTLININVSQFNPILSRVPVSFSLVCVCLYVYHLSCVYVSHTHVYHCSIILSRVPVSFSRVCVYVYHSLSCMCTSIILPHMYHSPSYSLFSTCTYMIFSLLSTFTSSLVYSLLCMCISLVCMSLSPVHVSLSCVC